jgi:hypothetical protein
VWVDAGGFVAGVHFGERLHAERDRRGRPGCASWFLLPRRDIRHGLNYALNVGRCSGFELSGIRSNFRPASSVR